MSWLSKLLRLFFDNQEEEYERKIDKNNSTEKIKDQSLTDDRLEMQARVTYQYPKGNFRFPLISDEETLRETRRPADAAKSKAKTSSERKQSRLNSAQGAQKERKSFQPTEIPSPIFGFGPRNRDDLFFKKIEEQYQQQTDIDVHDIFINDLEKQKEVQREFAAAEEIEINEMIEYENDYEKEISKTQDHEAEDSYFKITAPPSEDKQREAEKAQSVEASKLEMESKQETHLKQETILKQGTNLKQETDLKQGTDLNQEEGPKQETSLKQEADPKHLEKKSDDRRKPVSRGKLSSNQNEKTIIPYNVIMFGQDKRKLEVKEKRQNYLFPPLTLLNVQPFEEEADDQWIEKQKNLLDLTLQNFHVNAKVVNVSQGPSVTRFEVHPEPGVKVSKITNLIDDIKLSLSAKDIRIEAPIPGKNTIGIEVPNRKSKTVFLREILRSKAFQANRSPLTVALGLSISGEPIVTDLKKMPHGLIAGATGSGKSVCINTILVSLLYKATPNDVKMLLIDPKMVELAPYNRIPHLVSPVITDVKAATAALKWAVDEMERRYELFAHVGVRDIEKFNERVGDKEKEKRLPYIVIVIDELADLMMVSPNDVEEAICRIAQKARACGIHLLIATQRPSVDVITGLIKANIPTRIAFSVSSQIDSRTILDTSGAERLLGRGDMLFLENGSAKPVRVQGTFVSDDEIDRVVHHVKNQMAPNYLFKQEELLAKTNFQAEEDDLFYEACEFVVEQGHASASSLQRRFRIGYNRAARLIDLMEEQGIISPPKGSKPRDVLVSEEQLKTIKESS
ncbi:DNA translocase FtsK [Aeribacillus pallidus]|jgi:DNA segregation ATPase FtsK/SpoIIIE and related proteins|uniref:Cell division protein FtsK n=1 Tax=Aeribacillus pallidus TaxID=33936 RepID=A0A165YHB1_9BACI|nr:DNA translocase FtsK [Aeribacillus pallidus]KZN97074.1 cell division protein FtsK [Aeribacillus pallidus]